MLDQSLAPVTTMPTNNDFRCGSECWAQQSLSRPVAYWSPAVRSGWPSRAAAARVDILVCDITSYTATDKNAGPEGVASIRLCRLGRQAMAVPVAFAPTNALTTGQADFA